MQNFNQCQIENVAGRDINVVLPQPATTENLIECPVCRYPVSMRASACIACGHPVEKHFLEIIQEEQQQRNDRLILECFTIMVLGSIVSLCFTLPKSVPREYILLLGGGLFAFVLAYRCLIRKLEKWRLT
jgi:hypothetical protein